MDELISEEEKKRIAQRRARRKKKRAQRRRRQMIRNVLVIGIPLLLIIIVASVVIHGFTSKKSSSQASSEQTESAVADTEDTTESQTEEEVTQTEVVTTQASASGVTLSAAAALVTDPAYKNPMSSYEVHQGQWDLSTLDNTIEYLGYSEKYRDEQMIPMGWADKEKKYGMFNVDWIQDTSQKIIYLTMDDGYANSTTEPILDILKEKGVKVVFFITKEFLDNSKSTVQRMIDEGHQIGNHTCTHPVMPKLSIEEQTSQIMTLKNQMQDEFGYTMKLFRFPQGGFSPQSLALVENCGLKSVFWTYGYNDYDDANQPDVQESLQAAVNHLHPGAIFLLHASSTTNLAFLSDFIDQARAQGYEFGVYPTSAN